MIYSNDDMDLEQDKSFLTEANTSLIVRSDKKKYIVFKIEDVDPPSSENGQAIPLPENSNFSRVIDNILETLRKVNPKFISPQIVKAWRTHFSSTQCVSILSDMFWYCLVKIDKRPNLKQYKKDLLERVSQNYIQLFVNVPMHEKEFFFENFFDCIAQGVFYSMFFSYPKSRSRLNSEEFKRKLFELVSKSITGLCVKNEGFSNWILDLGAGNVLQKEAKPDTEQKLHLPQIKVKGQTRRTLQQLRYSPLVSRYLSSKRYEAINSVPTWSMRYTVRNLEKEKDLDERYAYYKKLAIDAERNNKERDKKFQDISLRIEEQIKENHREYREFVNNINGPIDESKTKKESKKFKLIIYKKDMKGITKRTVKND